jgi:hypothetical protein
MMSRKLLLGVLLFGCLALHLTSYSSAQLPTCCTASSDHEKDVICVPTTVMLARLLHMEKAKAPCCGKGLSEHGVVVASIEVSRQGDVVGFQILQGKPFGSASISQVLTLWKFKPLIKHGRARTFCGPVAIRYQLSDSSVEMAVLHDVPRGTE